MQKKSMMWFPSHSLSHFLSSSSPLPLFPSQTRPRARAMLSHAPFVPPLPPPRARYSSFSRINSPCSRTNFLPPSLSSFHPLSVSHFSILSIKPHIFICIKTKSYSILFQCMSTTYFPFFASKACFSPGANIAVHSDQAIPGRRFCIIINL